MQPQLRILLVDGSGTHSVILSRLLSELNSEAGQPASSAADSLVASRWSWQTVEGAEPGLLALDSGNYQLALVAEPEAGFSALEFLRLASLRATRVPLFLIANQADEHEDARALELGAAGSIDPRRIRPRALDRTLRFAHAQQRRVEALREQRDELLWMHRLTDFALGTREEGAFAMRAARLLAQRSGFPLVWVESYQPAERSLVCSAVHGLPARVLGERTPVSGSLAGRVLLSGRPQLEMSLDSSMLRLHEQQVGTWICLPMSAEAHPLGTVTLAHGEAFPVDSRELHALATLVEHFAKLCWRLDPDAGPETTALQPPIGSSSGLAHPW